MALSRKKKVKTDAQATIAQWSFCSVQALPVEEELVARVGVEPVLQHDLLGQQDGPVLLVEPPQLLSEMTWSLLCVVTSKHLDSETFTRCTFSPL